MPEIETQLRDYFDAAVERVTADDVLARHRVFDTVDATKRQRSLRPAWAAAAAFVATVVVLGGTFAVGLAMRRPAIDVGLGGVIGPADEAAPATSGSWLLVVVIALTIGAVGALIAKNHQHRIRREHAMATTLEAPPIEHLNETSQNNRRLVVAVAVLAVALVAAVAWTLFNQASAATAAPAAVEELMDSYAAAWADYDTPAFMALTTEDYSHTNSDGTWSRTETASWFTVILKVSQFQTEHIGDLVVIGNGPYYVTEANRLTTSPPSGAAIDRYGISTLVVVETDDGLKVAEHHWVGDPAPEEG